MQCQRLQFQFILTGSGAWTVQLKAIILSLEILLPPAINVSRTWEICNCLLRVWLLMAVPCPFPGATEPWEELLAILGDTLAIPHCCCYSWKPGMVVSSWEQPLNAAQSSKSRRSCRAGGAASAREKLLRSESKENGAWRMGWKLAPSQGI